MTIMVKDLDRSIEFYQSIGVTLVNRWDNNFALMQAADLMMELHPADGMVLNSGSVSLGFMCDEILDCKIILNKHNILFDERKAERSGVYLNFKDPDGTHLYFVKRQ